MPGAAAVRKARSPSREAVKQAAYRRRLRAGLRCFSVAVSDHVLECLIDRGLSPQAALDPQAVSRELAALLEQWGERWRREKS